MYNGYVKLYRKIFDSIIFQNEKLLKIFIWCLLKASHKEREQIIGRNVITLKEGQFIFGRNKAAAELNISPSTIWDYIKLMETYNIISIKSNNKYSVITIEKWEIYQGSKNNSDNKYNNNYDNKSTTDGQQIGTNNNVKNLYNEENENLYNEENEEVYSRIISKLNECANKNYKSNSIQTIHYIESRLREGFEEEDFYKVINNKCNEWLNNNDMNKYLRPKTLFGDKFEDYLNQDANNLSDKPDFNKKFRTSHEESDLESHEEEDLDEKIKNYGLL